MNKVIWKSIRGYKNYEVSNMGKVRNKETGGILKIQTNQAKTRYVTLWKNGLSKNLILGNLVLKAFGAKRLFTTIHIDGDHSNNKLSNLKPGTRAESLVQNRRALGKLRGVYKFPIGDKNWRAILAVDKKSITIGYFKTKAEAIIAFYNAYKNKYGAKPFNLRKILTSAACNK